jgi:hypothetical protein
MNSRRFMSSMGTSFPMRYQRGEPARVGSFDQYTGFLDWHCPFLDFACQEFLQVFRRSTFGSNNCGRQSSKALLHGESIQRCNGRLIELADDWLWCALRHEEAIAVGRLEICETLLLGTGQIWQGRQASLSDHLVGTGSESLIDRLPSKAISSMPKLAKRTPFAFVVNSLLVRTADYAIGHHD